MLSTVENHSKKLITFIGKNIKMQKITTKILFHRQKLITIYFFHMLSHSRQKNIFCIRTRHLNSDQRPFLYCAELTNESDRILYLFFCIYQPSFVHFHEQTIPKNPIYISDNKVIFPCCHGNLFSSKQPD